MASDNLRDRIAAAIANTSAEIANENYGVLPDPLDCRPLADAVIRELDLGIPCATTGCRMRQIARRGAERVRKHEGVGGPSCESGDTASCGD